MADIIVQVNFEALQSTITQLENLRDEYQNTYNGELYGKVLEEVKVAFKGDTSDAFVGKVNDFKNDFEKMYQVLGEYIVHLKEVLKNYKNIEETRSQNAKSLAGDAN